MEVGSIQSTFYVSQARRAPASELLIDTNEIKSILYLGMKGVNHRAAQAEEIADTSHTIDTFV
jgi:hypothetical protein